MKKMVHPKLSIVIPVYNEQKTILDVLDAVETVDLGDIKKEIIIVDDFSTDGTREILKNLKKTQYKIFFHSENQGKGSALRTGFKRATGDIIIIQDADLEYNPHEYSKLLKPVLSKETNVVYGSRFLSHHIPRYTVYYWGNILLSWLTTLLYLKRVSDMETCYKVFTKEALDSLNLRGRRFDIEPEITAKVLKKGYNILEIPISYQCRAFSEGKKINWKDGIKAVYYLLKYRFVN